MVAHGAPGTNAKFWVGADGQPMYFVRAGSGSSVLLLHGLLGSSFCWRLNLPVLTRQRTAYSVDFPGLGLSDAPARTNCGMVAQAKRLVQFLEQHDLERVDIVASSWGGAIALLVAAANPRVRSLVLAAPVNPWSQFGRERIRFCAGFWGRWLVRCGLPFSRRFHRLELERMYGDPARIPPGSLEGYSELLLRRGRAGSLINILQNWERDLEAVSEAIPRVRVPTLLIWGTQDGAVDVRSAEPLKNAIGPRRCRVEILPGVGHLPFEEAPEVFNRLVLDFLEQPA